MMKHSSWQMIETLLSLSHTHTIHVFSLEAVQNGVRPCHRKRRQVLHHQISGEGESETG
jgi:hypothetical protein